MTNLDHKIEYSINFIRQAEKIAIKMQPEKGFWLAFSGGKDSQTLYHLAQMAGVKFEAHYSLSTLDPPELVNFIKQKYPDVIIDRPKLTFLQLIEKKKQLPLKHVRYCCAELKESSGGGFANLIGIRKSESIKRSKRNEVEISGYKFSGSLDQFNRYTEIQEQCMAIFKKKDKLIISPIFNWTDLEVWQFIKQNKFEYCKLYDEGFHRLGCLFCPMASAKRKSRERIRYPRYEQAIVRSIQRILNKQKYFDDYNATAQEIFDWWISNRSAAEFFAEKRYQLILNFEHNNI